MSKREQNMSEWLGLINQVLQGQKTINEVCEEKGVSRQTYHYWKGKFPSVAYAELPKPVKQVSGASKKPRNFLQLAIRSLKNRALSKRLVLRVMDRYDKTFEEACEIVGITSDEIDYKPRTEQLPDSTIEAEIRSLMEDGKITNKQNCADKLRELHPDWTRRQIRRVYDGIPHKWAIRQKAKQSKKDRKDFNSLSGGIDEVNLTFTRRTDSGRKKGKSQKRKDN